MNKQFSSWRKVTSGVPQGSVLGPILFLIYINDLDVGIVSKLSKFADDSKLCKSINCDNDRLVLQNDLDNLHEWSQKWQMQFNGEKCSVIHLGNRTRKYSYNLSNHQLKKSHQERDLGVIVESSGKFSAQCNMAVNKASATLGIIRRHIKYKNKSIISRLYKALVRPQLEYCVQVWNPQLKRDINNLEKIQHCVPKLIPEYKRLLYEDSVNYIKLNYTGKEV